MWYYADPPTSLELLNYYLTLAMSSGRFAYYVIHRDDTTNDSIFYMSGGIQFLQELTQVALSSNTPNIHKIESVED